MQNIYETVKVSGDDNDFFVEVGDDCIVLNTIKEKMILSDKQIELLERGLERYFEIKDKSLLNK